METRVYTFYVHEWSAPKGERLTNHPAPAPLVAFPPGKIEQSATDSTDSED